MAGIYIHIPFCRKACHYCNFHFSTSLGPLESMVEALVREMDLATDFLPDREIRTVYFGGGTPSLLPEADVARLLDAVKDRYIVNQNAEITLEANPDDITPVKLKAWKDAGVNRLSIGVQSFREEDLRWMNRAHNAEQAKAAIVLAREAGFGHDSIDLIYGTPGLSDEDWEKNVAAAIALGVPHLSCYALTVEPRTALARNIRVGKIAPVDPESQARQFELLISWLTDAGYEHYEISNFALPGHRSRHNSSYWQGEPYLGLGPSAHSFDGKSRRWNIANNALYLRAVQQGELPFEEEILTPVQQLNEYTMTSLRTMEGLSLERVASLWGDAISARLVHLSRNFLEKGWMLQQEGRLVLTPGGKLFADGIASDLFFDEGSL